MKRTDLEFDDMLAFQRVVETGSFARAGVALGVSKSIVSRRVARLEARLGAQLLTRTARGAVPTETGRAYHARLRMLFGELEAANEAVSDAAARIAGPIRITAPIALVVNYLAPAFAEFARLHPAVELDIDLDDRKVDLLGGRYDLAIRIGALADSSLIARRLAPVRSLVVASPAYLAAHGRPRRPSDLTDHELLFYANIDPGSEWRFPGDGRTARVRATSRLRVNNGDAMRELVRAGLGIAVLPDFIARTGLSDGSLEHLLPDHPLPEVGIHVVMPPGRAGLARVRALVDHLVRAFVDQCP